MGHRGRAEATSELSAPLLRPMAYGARAKGLMRLFVGVRRNRCDYCGILAGGT